MEKIDFEGKKLVILAGMGLVQKRAIFVKLRFGQLFINLRKMFKDIDFPKSHNTLLIYVNQLTGLQQA